MHDIPIYVEMVVIYLSTVGALFIGDRLTDLIKARYA